MDKVGNGLERLIMAYGEFQILWRSLSCWELVSAWMLQPEKLRSREPSSKTSCFQLFSQLEELNCGSKEWWKVCFCQMQEKKIGNAWASPPTSKELTRHFCHGNILPHQISHSFQQGTRTICILINMMTEIICWVKLMRWRMLTSHGFVLFSLSITWKLSITGQAQLLTMWIYLHDLIWNIEANLLMGNFNACFYILNKKQ